VKARGTTHVKEEERVPRGNLGNKTNGRRRGVGVRGQDSKTKGEDQGYLA